MRAIVVIPARMASLRLPDKPLADIGGRPMILHVWDRAIEADLGPVVVATDTPAIRDAIEDAGGRAVMTRPDHPSGSDRVFEAVERIDPEGRHAVIVNLQGDLPLIDPATIRAAGAALTEPETMLGTVCAEIATEAERQASSVVKMVGTPIGPDRFRALYFTRTTAPWGDGPLYHHIGIYAWQRAGLSRFVTLAPSPLERRERLEQLRVLENGMRIDVLRVDDVPLGVDTPADLEEARARHASRIRR